MASALFSSRRSSCPGAAWDGKSKNRPKTAASTGLTLPNTAGAAKETKLSHFEGVWGLLFIPRSRFFRPPEEEVDARIGVGVLIALKVQFRHVPELQPGGKFAAEIPAGVDERRKCLILFAFVAVEAYFDGGMPGIGADLNLGHIDLEQTRIVQLKPNDLTEFLADRLANP
jgi:hypothetical protein